MARKKVKLAFIENNTARKSTYKKRSKSLVRKVGELSTLCGIDACAIIYGPYDPQPEIWPSPSGVEKVLSKFQAVPESEQSKKMVNQERLLKQMILKAEKQLTRQCRETREKETTLLMFQSLNAGKVVQNDRSVAGLNDLAWMIDHNLKEIGRRIESVDNEMNIHQMEPPLLLLPPPPPQPTVPGNKEIAMTSYGHLQMAPPLLLLPPPPPQPNAVAPNNDEIAMMGYGHVGMAMNNNGIMINGGELETISNGFDANLQNRF